VTDADLIMNRIDPHYFLGGKMELSREKAEAVIRKEIAEPMGIDVYEASQAICNIVDDAMGYMLRLNLRERGLDPQKFAFICFGGAGPTHCAGLIRDINFMRVIIPRYASVFSAFGASTADIAHRYEASPNIVVHSVPYSSSTLRFNIDALDQIPAWAIERYNDTFERLILEAYSQMDDEGFKRENVSLSLEVQMRYGGQLWEQVIYTDVGHIAAVEDLQSLLTAYENHYEKAYGFASMYPQGGFEIISLVLNATVNVPKPTIAKARLQNSNPFAAYKGKRDVYFKDRFEEAGIYDMAKLKAGHFLEGPSIAEGVDTNVVIPPGFALGMDEYSNMILTKVK
jgi:N-methylhydantoinase A/oxoprolinase/acetone carboxylase beta subunit